GFIRDQVLGEGYPQLALPAWGNRGLRHRAVVARKGSRVQSLSDLKGGRIGNVHYGMTTNLWARNALSEAGVNLEEATWVVTVADDMTPPDLKIEVLGDVQSGGLLWPLLVEDKIDATIAPGHNFFYGTFQN